MKLYLEATEDLGVNSARSHPIVAAACPAAAFIMPAYWIRMILLPMSQAVHNQSFV